jgi:hypothetical protein
LQRLRKKLLGGRHAEKLQPVQIEQLCQAPNVQVKKMKWFTLLEKGYYLPVGDNLIECPSCGNLVSSKQNLLEVEERIGCIKCLR